MQKARKFQNNFDEIWQNSEFGAVRKCADIVDLEKCSKMSIWLRKLASIQPRTDRPKFGAEKCGFGSWYMYLKKKPESKRKIRREVELVRGPCPWLRPLLC